MRYERGRALRLTNLRAASAELYITQSVLQLTAAVSRKTHGGAGDFDINLPLTGQPGVECRNSNGTETLVFSFTNNVVSGNAMVTSGTGTAGTPTFAGKTMTVTLSGVTDVQKLSVTLSNVTDTFAQILPATAVGTGKLVGDSNGDGTVNSGDAIQTRSRSGQLADPTNFRSDANADGAVNAGDAFIVRSRSGGSVLP